MNEAQERLKQKLIADLDGHIATFDAEFAATDWHDWRHMDAFEHARNLRILRAALTHTDLQRSLLRRFFELEAIRLKEKERQMTKEGEGKW